MFLRCCHLVCAQLFNFFLILIVRSQIKELCCWKLIFFCPSTPTPLRCSMAFYLEEVMNCTRSLLLVVSGWIPRHVIGAVLVSLPAVSVLSHLTCSVHLPLQVKISIAVVTQTLCTQDVQDVTFLSFTDVPTTLAADTLLLKLP